MSEDFHYVGAISSVFEDYGINKSYIQSHEKWLFGDMPSAINQFCWAECLTAIIKDKTLGGEGNLGVHLFY